MRKLIKWFTPFISTLLYSLKIDPQYPNNDKNNDGIVILPLLKFQVFNNWNRSEEICYTENRHTTHKPHTIEKKKMKKSI